MTRAWYALNRSMSIKYHNHNFEAKFVYINEMMVYIQFKVNNTVLLYLFNKLNANICWQKVFMKTEIKCCTNYHFASSQLHCGLYWNLNMVISCSIWCSWVVYIISKFQWNNSCNCRVVSGNSISAITLNLAALKYVHQIKFALLLFYFHAVSFIQGSVWSILM